MIDWLIVTDNENDITHSRIRHTGLDRLQVQEQLGGGAVLQHLHHLLQHRQVHRLDHLHRRLHLLHFFQDLVTFCPWTFFVYVPPICSDLLIDICDVAETGKNFKQTPFCGAFLSRIPQKVVDVIFKKLPEDGRVCLLGCVITLGAPGHTNCARRGRRPTEKPMLVISHQSLNWIKFENSPWESCYLCFEACQFICLRCYSVLQVLYQVRQLRVIMNFTLWLLREIMSDEQMTFDLILTITTILHWTQPSKRA